MHCVLRNSTSNFRTHRKSLVSRAFSRTCPLAKERRWNHTEIWMRNRLFFLMMYDSFENSYPIVYFSTNLCEVGMAQVRSRPEPTLLLRRQKVLPNQEFDSSVPPNHLSVVSVHLSTKMTFYVNIIDFIYRTLKLCKFLSTR